MEFDFEGKDLDNAYKLLAGLVTPRPIALISTMDEDGWMNAALCHGERPTLTGNPAWHTDAPDADRLAAQPTVRKVRR